MATVHNSAPKGSIAKLVIVTGDPERCKLFAEMYLENRKLLSQVRGIYCYTGTYKGVEITFMGHGMGQGSMGIYSYELMAPMFYDADFVIRLGSCGGLNQKTRIRDIVVVEKIRTNSNYGELLHIPHRKGETVQVDPQLVELAHKCAKDLNISLQSTTNWSQDNFYIPLSHMELGEHTGCDTVEMESYALEVNSRYLKKKALTILTVVNETRTDTGWSSLKWQEREQTLGDMFLLGLEVLVQYSKLNPN
ncbi:Purine nucleoside phosphorylase [Mycoplasma wenyonii str. Massachusetts]|uniref:Uridine phosphorylase n=1 Tax=Mycoplasma wenyonii (strain Massachusetts) TaxID=1197325 RepID=I6Z5Z4_MYCWM|nr:purine-nucleoside phosphorylase [Mycoplasma wenyonii]AFN64993.1 Purine nucleoside phosphorylase [Mycoplasma wenyonii str. Massachusetts]